MRTDDDNKLAMIIHTRTWNSKCLDNLSVSRVVLCQVLRGLDKNLSSANTASDIK